MKPDPNFPEPKPGFQFLFHPRSIAHVGASPKNAAGRFPFLQYLEKMEFPGALLPVNPNYPEVFGKKCHPSLAEVPGEIDLAILAIPAQHCPAALRDVPPGKLKFVIIHTSGFGEIGKGELEREILELARAKNFRVIGPNCMGVLSRDGRVCFWDDHRELKDREGWLGYVSQSGGLTIEVISGGIDLGIGYNKAVSLGNQIDVSIAELISFMADDPKIQVIACYVEDVKNGRAFLDAVRRAATKKPVLVWKGGLNQLGQAASATHTGSMASNTSVFRAAMAQAGAIVIDNFEEMMKALRILEPPVTLPGKRLAIICPGGGNTVGIGDAFGARPGIELPLLSPETRAALQALLPEENVDVKNPVDPGAVGMTKLDQIAAITGKDPNVDAVILMLSDEITFHFKNDNTKKTIAGMMAAMAKKARDETSKPLYIHLLHVRDNNLEVWAGRRLIASALQEHHVPWIDGPFLDSARLFEKLTAYAKYRERATSSE